MGGFGHSEISVNSRPFHEQLAYYIEQLHNRGVSLIYSDAALNEHGIPATRAQLDQMQLAQDDHRGLAPSASFVNALVGALNTKGLLTNPDNKKAFIEGAHAVRLMAEKRGWKILGDHPQASNVARPQTKTYAALLKHEAGRKYNPAGCGSAKPCSAMLEESFANGENFASFLEKLMQEWNIPDAVVCTDIINKNLAKHASEEKETVKADMVRLWRNDAHREQERAYVQPVQLFCKAFGLDEMQERMIWKMMRGKPFGVGEYYLLEQQAREQKNLGVLVQGLVEASGIPKTYFKGHAQVHHLPANLGGAKFSSPEEAQRFMDYAFPADWGMGQGADPQIIRCHGSAVKLLCDTIALPPRAMERVRKARTAKQILDETLEKDGRFGDFLSTLMQEWQVSSLDLSEVIAYNYRRATGEDKKVWESTLEQWRDKPASELQIHPEGMVIFCRALGLEEQDQMNAWYLVGGRKPRDLAKLVAAAQQGNTGPLIKELVEASGIPTGHLEDITPTSQLHEWMQGTKIVSEQIGRHFLDLVYPPSRLPEQEPSKAILANHEKILEGWVYKQVVSETTRQRTRDRMVAASKDEAERFSAAVEQNPFAPVLEAVTQERGGWHDTINRVLAAWGTEEKPASPQQFVNVLAARNGSEDESVSFNAVYAWKDQPEITAIAPASVACLVKAFGLSELQELMIWKQKCGRYLEPDELADTIKEVGHGSPEKLVRLLKNSAGIPEGRFKKLLDVVAIDKWMGGCFIATHDTARRLVNVALGVEYALMDDEQKKQFDATTRNDLVRALTGRPLSVADIMSHGFDGKIPTDGHAFLKALCGPRGMQTLSDKEFSEITDIGDWETRQVRRGSHVLQEEPAKRLLRRFDGGNVDQTALAALTTAPPKKSEGRGIQTGSTKAESRRQVTDDE